MTFIIFVIFFLCFCVLPEYNLKINFYNKKPFLYMFKLKTIDLFIKHEVLICSRKNQTILVFPFFLFSIAIDILWYNFQNVNIFYDLYTERKSYFMTFNNADISCRRRTPMEEGMNKTTNNIRITPIFSSLPIADIINSSLYIHLKIKVRLLLKYILLLFAFGIRRRKL